MSFFVEIRMKSQLFKQKQKFNFNRRTATSKIKFTFGCHQSFIKINADTKSRVSTIKKNYVTSSWQASPLFSIPYFSHSLSLSVSCFIFVHLLLFHFFFFSSLDNPVTMAYKNKRVDGKLKTILSQLTKSIPFLLWMWT